jgi:hypothetical protein
MIKKLAAAFASISVLTMAPLAVPEPAGAMPAPPPCLVTGPGPSSCAGYVTFSSYYLSTLFRPFQGAPGTGVQPDVQVIFSGLVRNLRAWANDPDTAGNKAWAHLYGCCWLQLTSINGDGTPGVFSVGGGGGIANGPFDRVLLQTDPSDYVNWRVEYQTNVNQSGPWCMVNAATVNCQGVTATVSPFAQGSGFDPFQATNNGTGPQAPIDVTFQYPLAEVAVTALDPDLGGNRMEAYAADGTLLATAYFDGDNRIGFSNVSTKSIAFANIKRIRLIAADNDYTVFQGITAWPMGPPPPPPPGCTINVTGGTHNCSGVPGISVQSLSGGRLLLKLTFTPGQGQTANLAVTYNAAPTGFTVNIGDSSTNDGGGGDGATQSNDAEMMIQGQQLSVFGRDGTPTYPLYTVPNMGIGAGAVVNFEVADRNLCWRLLTYTCLNSEWLYALNGQPDTEGPVNYDIYAAFNRVITGRTDRNGTGVSSVSVFLS